AEVAEGSRLTLGLRFTDPGPDTVSSYSVNWGDGQVETVQAQSASGLAPSHVYRDNGLYTVVIFKVTDDEGTFAQLGSLAVKVTDVAPTITLSGDAQALQGRAYTLTLGAVIDPGQDRVSGYTVQWGDGNEDTFAGAPARTLTH